MDAVNPTASHRSIVVGVDGSPAAATALRWAARRAAATGVPLELIHTQVLPGPIPTVPLAAWAPPIVPAEYTDAGQAILDAAAEVARHEAPEVRVRTTLAVGGAAEALVEESATAELVVVGTRGTGGFSGLLLGSVSVQVSSHAHCPTVVVGEAEAGASGPIVVGVDGSAASTAAVRFAFAEADRLDRPVVAVHSWGVPRPTGFGEAIVEALFAGDAHEERRGAAQRLLDEALAPAQEAFPGVRVRQHLTETSAAAALIDAAAEAGLVVVGSRGHGGFTGLLLGSTSQNVLHHAPCPVAITRAEARPHR